MLQELLETDVIDEALRDIQVVDAVAVTECIPLDLIESTPKVRRVLRGHELPSRLEDVRFFANEVVSSDTKVQVGGAQHLFPITFTDPIHEVPSELMRLLVFLMNLGDRPFVDELVSLRDGEKGLFFFTTVALMDVVPDEIYDALPKIRAQPSVHAQVARFSLHRGEHRVHDVMLAQQLIDGILLTGRDGAGLRLLRPLHKIDLVRRKWNNVRCAHPSHTIKTGDARPTFSR